MNRILVQNFVEDETVRLFLVVFFVVLESKPEYLESVNLGI